MFRVLSLAPLSSSFPESPPTSNAPPLKFAVAVRDLPSKVIEEFVFGALTVKVPPVILNIEAFVKLLSRRTVTFLPESTVTVSSAEEAYWLSIWIFPLEVMLATASDILVMPVEFEQALSL